LVFAKKKEKKKGSHSRKGKKVLGDAILDELGACHPLSSVIEIEYLQSKKERKKAWHTSTRDA